MGSEAKLLALKGEKLGIKGLLVSKEEKSSEKEESYGDAAQGILHFLFINLTFTY